MKKTKIIATLGPATNNEKSLIQLYKAWVNIIRFNFSHANYDDAKKSIDMIKKLNKQWKTNLSMLLDTKGPEIRTWDLKEKNIYEKWDKFNIYIDPKVDLKTNDLFCDYPYLAKDIKIWKNIVIDSWLLSVKVIEKKKNHVVVKALNYAVIWSRRHINLPGVKLKMPWITQKDREDIIFWIENDFSFIAASFIRSKENVLEIRDLLKEKKCTNIQIISKIENEEGVKNLDEIVDASDWIMVARWDLWIEVPIQKLAVHQKEIVDKCNNMWKFAITATHLLETMIENPFPTRAESSDVFNSVMQKTDCLMLSWETAIWKFPIASVQMMTSIIKEAEKSIKYNHESFTFNWLTKRDLEKKVLIKSALFTWDDLKVKAWIILTKSWLLARLTSAFKPNFPVYAFTPNEKSVKSMNILFWIKPFYLKKWNPENFTETMDEAIKFLINEKIIDNKDRLIAVNDIQRQWREIPVMEIIDLSQM
jgi:pyruvate kinase